MQPSRSNPLPSIEQPYPYRPKVVLVIMALAVVTLFVAGDEQEKHRKRLAPDVNACAVDDVSQCEAEIRNACPESWGRELEYGGPNGAIEMYVYFCTKAE